MAKLVVRGPFADFGAFVENARGARSLARPVAGPGPTRMPVNVYETDGGIAFDATLPGFESDDINVTYEQGRLTIRAEHNVESCEDERHNHTDRQYRHREVYRSRVERSFNVGEQFEADAICADLHNGVLHLELARAASAVARSIPINSN